MYGNTKKETIILSDNAVRFCGSYFARRIFTYLADIFKNSRMDIVYRRLFYFDVRRMRNGAYRVRYGNALDDFRTNRYIIADSNRRHGRRYHRRVRCRYFRQKNRSVQPRNDEKCNFCAKCERNSSTDRIYNQRDFFD